MNVPVFRKTVTLANLSGIAVAVCPIMPFYKSSVNHLANRRVFYRSFYFGFAAKDNLQVNLYHPAFAAPLVDSGIFQIPVGDPASSFGAARFTGWWGRNLYSISSQDGLFIRPELVRGYQIHNPTSGSFLKILHEFLNIFGSAFARYYTNYQLIPSSPQAIAGQTMAYLFVRKIASCMFDSIAAEYGCFCRTSRILSDYLPRVYHNPGISYSGNRILKELSLSYLRYLTVYGATTCPLIPDISKTT